MDELQTAFDLNFQTVAAMAIRFMLLAVVFTIVQTGIALLPKHRSEDRTVFQALGDIFTGRHLINEQRIFRRGFSVDMLHFFVGRLAVNLGIALTTAAAVGWSMEAPFMQPVRSSVGALPVWLTAPVGLLIILLFDYWDHRTAHTWKWRWRFHAIHHTTKEMDWLASVRLHPVDQIIHRFVAYAPVLMLGFPILEIFVPLFAVMGFVAIFDHSNVRVEFPGWITRVIATPHYHHWHHAMKPIDKNFGAMSPLMDQIFGTYFVPKGRYPEEYGIPYDIEDKFADHMLTPFGYKGVWKKAWGDRRVGETQAHDTAQ